MSKKESNGFRIYKLLLTCKGLSSTEKMVLLSIADHLGNHEEAWPGFGRISHEAGCSRRTTIYTIKKLEARGLLKVVRDEKPATACDTNSYSVQEEALAALSVPFRRRGKRAPAPVQGLHHTGDTSARAAPPLVQALHHPSATVAPERPKNSSGESPTPASPGKARVGEPPAEKKAGGGELHNLLNEIEAGAELKKSKIDCSAPMRDLLQQLPATVRVEDFVSAANHTSFDALRDRSLGLLLSAKFRERYYHQVLHFHKERIAAETEAANRPIRCLRYFESVDPTERLSAVEWCRRFLDRAVYEPLLDNCLHDADHRVRFAAQRVKKEIEDGYLTC